jgi:hypothetical protein
MRGAGGERQRLIADGMVREGSYTVADAVRDYVADITAEKTGPLYAGQNMFSMP